MFKEGSVYEDQAFKAIDAKKANLQKCEFNNIEFVN